MADKNDLGRNVEGTEKKDNLFKRGLNWGKKHWKGIVAAAAGVVAAGAGGYFLGKNHNENPGEEAPESSEPVTTEPTYSDLPDA